MLRIGGSDIPENKQVFISLTSIYGIGRVLALKILKDLNIVYTKKVKDLTEQEASDLRKLIEGNYKIEGELRREVTKNIKRLQEIKCWRGLRHLKGLPCRGQKTRKNSRSVRGNVRKTVSSGRKAAPAPK